MRASLVSIFCFITQIASIAPIHAQEKLFFDMDKVVTQYGTDMGCFPKGNDAPAENNGNWKSPIDYTTGTVHVRVEIRSMPTNFCLRPSFAIWVSSEGGGGELVIPNAARPAVNATPDPLDTTVGTAQFAFSDWLYYYGATTAAWTVQRSKLGPVFKSCDGKFLHSKDSWGQGVYGGYDPADIYPIDIRMSLVVVASGSVFSGWDTYIKPNGEVAISESRDLRGSMQARAMSATAQAPRYYDLRGRMYPRSRDAATPGRAGTAIRLLVADNDVVLKTLTNSIKK